MKVPVDAMYTNMKSSKLLYSLEKITFTEKKLKTSIKKLTG